MPSIVTASIPVTRFKSQFVSPFGNDGVIPLYSSIPILTAPENTACLPCVVCGNSTTRYNILAQEATSVQSALVNSVNVAVGT
jgi:hypothetical protein